MHESGLAGYIEGLMSAGLKQLNAWDDTGKEHAVKLTKDGKVLSRAGKSSAPKPVSVTHNREKKYIIREGDRIPVLADIGIFTRDGSVAAPMYDKYRQINRFLEIIDDVFGKDPPKRIRAVDFGCGKSYLTFLLYHYFTEVLGIEAEILGLDLKADVIRSCEAAALKYGYTGLSFRQGDIAGFDLDYKPDMLISLHACDTATDYALFQAVRMNAGAIFAVPCCQHELNAQMRPNALTLFSRYGTIKERAAALITDAIRANLLTWAGYKTQLLEYVDFDHSPKNIMIRAVKTILPDKTRKTALSEAADAMDEFNLSPTLYRLMIGDNKLMTETK
jgi:SAM-dependent methyltransferase